MTYRKPEIVELGNAVRVIQGKPVQDTTDGSSKDPILSAYDLDE